VTFTKVLTVYHSWIHPLHHSLLSSLTHYWNSFNVSHFSICIQKYIIFPLHSPSYILSLYPPPLAWVPYTQTKSVLPSCSLILKKWRHFCLFKIAIQGVLLWHFHVYLYYNTNWLIPSFSLLSTLVPFLWWGNEFKYDIFVTL
jgi:hypothetical protein